MNGNGVPLWFPFAFPLFFVVIWLLVTTIVGVTSGWFGLQQWYADDRSDEPLLKLKRQSGVMGGLAINNALILAACHSGLSVRMSRILAPFQRPLLVPWSEIEAEPSRSFFTPMVKLSLGKPSNGTLKIPAHSWARLVEAVGHPAGLEMPAVAPITQAAVARGMFFEWLIITAVGGAFFLTVSRAAGPAGAIPLAICVGLPAIVFGIAQLVRFARQS